MPSTPIKANEEEKLNKTNIINKNNNYDNYDNYDNVEIRIKMENSCFIDKESNYSKSIRLLNIIYK